MVFNNLLCNSSFEQRHLGPWRYINAFIIIIRVVSTSLWRRVIAPERMPVYMIVRGSVAVPPLDRRPVIEADSVIDVGQRQWVDMINSFISQTPFDFMSCGVIDGLYMHYKLTCSNTRGDCLSCSHAMRWRLSRMDDAKMTDLRVTSPLLWSFSPIIILYVLTLYASTCM